MVSERPSHRAFFVVSALLFVASAAVTIVWCASISAMGEMPMPGGWTMSMAWMRMPGQTWGRQRGVLPRHVGHDDGGDDAAVTGSNAGGYRQAVGRTGEMCLGPLTALVGVGYFVIWTVFGAVSQAR
jgi:hypothetical protein